MKLFRVKVENKEGQLLNEGGEIIKYFDLA